MATNFGHPGITNLLKYHKIDERLYSASDLSSIYITKFSALVDMCMLIKKVTQFCSSPRDVTMVTNEFWGLFADLKLTAFTLWSGVPKWNELSPGKCTL